mmetsp:Transcript_11106/g.25780  ORF Transcript_11106/g.25780 Transcript_11106/m.25780 type:complete len:289 (-) Transcript_11106:217-1083(-)
MASLADYFAANGGGGAAPAPVQTSFARTASAPTSAWNSDVTLSSDARLPTSQKVHWSKRGGHTDGNVLHQSAPGLISPTKGAMTSYADSKSSKKREEIEKVPPKQKKAHSARNVSNLAMWNENHTGGPAVPIRHQSGSVTRPERNARRNISSATLINNASSVQLGGGNFSESSPQHNAAAAKRDWLRKAEKQPRGLQVPLVGTPTDSSYDLVTGKPVERKSPGVTPAERRRQGLATLNREAADAADEPAYLQSHAGRKNEYKPQNKHSEVRKWQQANAKMDKSFSRDR